MIDLNKEIDFFVNIFIEILAEQEGDDFLHLFEGLRNKLGENFDADSVDVSSLIGDLELLGVSNLTKIIRAFNLFFHISNIAEEHVKYIDRSQKFENHLWKSSFNNTIKLLHDKSYSAGQVQALLNKIDFKPVFTAHPTEAKRRTILQVINKIKQAYKTYIEAATDSRRFEAKMRIKALIQILWKTEEVREDKPSVVQEIETSLYYFKTTIFSVIPELYKNLHRALKHYYPNDKFDIPKIIGFGSWVGGDRDGNPFVTPDLTRKALRLQQVEVLSEYAKRVDDLCELLTHSDEFCDLSDELKVDLAQSDQLAQLVYAEKVDREHKTEPYRRKLGMMAYRLRRRIALCNARLNDDVVKDDTAYAYQSADEFKRDLSLIHDSLHHHNDDDLANGSLRDLMRLVEVFDFYLNKLDIRQESIEHSAVVAEILAFTDIEADYESLDETKKVERLNQCLNQKTLVNIDIEKLTESAQSIIAVFTLVNEMRAEIGANCFDAYIISMTRSASHILEVAILAQIVGLNNGEKDKSLAISPLFETIEDLENAPEVLDKLFSVPEYDVLLKQQSNRQEIMLGYSDSCKDGGIVASSWNLYLAQKAILQVVDKYKLDCCLFHGRGGTVARGGGNNVYEAIQSQPAGTIRGSIKFTEQGEVLSDRYHDIDTALHELTMGLSALIEASILETDKHDVDYYDCMNRLVAVGEKRYRDLTDDNKGLMQYFYETTPTHQIGLLNIGSRPSHRKKLDYSKKSIRAIGWVFAWAQCRLNIPGWFGLGSALADQPIEDIRAMYQNLPFFKTMLDKTEMVLTKTDINIAEHYSNLCQDEALAKEVYQQFKAEHQLVIDQIKAITNAPLLDKQKDLQKSLVMRKVYLAPLNYIQVILLARIAKSKDDEQWIQPLLRSINALAIGLRNTG